jgi:carboxyl-terminal processing protease
MRRILATFGVTIGLALGCRTPAPTPPPTPRPWRALDAAARADPRLAGVWEAEGLGRVVVVAADSVHVFHRSAGRCVADPGFVPGFALYALGTSGSAAGPRLALLHQDYGPDSEAMQTRLEHRRLPALPAECASRTDEERPTPEAVFDALDALMRAHYAFFAARGVDWDRLRARYRPLAVRAADVDALVPVLQEMLGHLNDGHLNLSRRGGDTFNAGRPALRERLLAAWRREGSRGASGEYVAAWHRQVVGSVAPLLDAGSRRQGAGGALEWGTIDDSVAYVRVHRFSGLATGNVPRPAQLDSLRAALDRMLTDIGGTKAAIVDVAMNGGGMDAAAVLVAQRFADRARPVLTKQVGGGAAQTVVLRPDGGRRFTAPVVVLTSEITASAAEVFVLMMRALPHVTHAGERTRGILSDLLPKPLPGGFMVTLSHQTVRDAEGRLFEATGIPPEEALALFPPGRERTVFAEAIRGVAARLARAPRGR